MNVWLEVLTTSARHFGIDREDFYDLFYLQLHSVLQNTFFPGGTLGNSNMNEVNENDTFRILHD